MALVTLKNTTEKLQVLLSGAVATSECPITASYADYRKDALAGGNEASPVFGDDDAITNGGTAVDVIDPPPTGIRRVITSFSLFNDDTTNVTVTVRKYVSSTTTRIVFYGTILTNETVHYTEARGWFVTNANGEEKVSSTADMTNASSQASSIAAAIVPASINSVSSQASSLAGAIVVASVNSVSSQASSLAAGIVVASVNSVSSQASSLAAGIVVASVNSVSSQASSMAKALSSSFGW